MKGLISDDPTVPILVPYDPEPMIPNRFLDLYRSVNALSRQVTDAATSAHSLYERYAEGVRATTLAIVDPLQWTGVSLHEVIKTYVNYLLLVGRDRNELQKLTTELTKLNPAGRLAINVARSELEGGMYALILSRRSEIGHPDPERAARFVLDQIGVMVRARLSDGWAADGTGVDDPVRYRQFKVDDEAFVAELMRSVAAYLDLPSPS